jgi:hypothetical protein
MHQQVLKELTQDLVVSSRGLWRPRGVKRKMSGYPVRPQTPGTRLWTELKDVIRLVTK